jgi:hypothetical protein
MPFPRTDAEINAFLKVLALKAPDHKEQYNLSQATLDQLSDDSIVFDHTLLTREVMDNEDDKLQAFKEDSSEGDPKGADLVFPTFSFPALPPMVNPPKPGIKPRNKELYNFLKSHPDRDSERWLEWASSIRPPRRFRPTT